MMMPAVIGVCLIFLPTMALAEDSAQPFYDLEAVVDKFATAPLSGENAAKARASAEALLDIAGRHPKNWNYGNAVHHAHLVLGRVTLLENQVPEAIAELMRAGQTPGSPQLDSFGPNMTLAKELLERGERAAVLEYFEECRNFWKPEFAAPPIAEWQAAIFQGRIPDFGANLFY